MLDHGAISLPPSTSEFADQLMRMTVPPSLVIMLVHCPRGLEIRHGHLHDCGSASSSETFAGTRRTIFSPFRGSSYLNRNVGIKSESPGRGGYLSQKCHGRLSSGASEGNVDFNVDTSASLQTISMASERSVILNLQVLAAWCFSKNDSHSPFDETFLDASDSSLVSTSPEA